MDVAIEGRVGKGVWGSHSLISSQSYSYSTSYPYAPCVGGTSTVALWYGIFMRLGGVGHCWCPPFVRAIQSRTRAPSIRPVGARVRDRVAGKKLTYTFFRHKCHSTSYHTCMFCLQALFLHLLSVASVLLLRSGLRLTDLFSWVQVAVRQHLVTHGLWRFKCDLN